MTTAHRPTWNPTKGSEESGSKLTQAFRHYSSRAMPSYTKLKEREQGQGTLEELKSKDFKKDLIEREIKNKRLKDGEISIQQDQLFEIESAEIRKKIKVDPDQDQELLYESSQSSYNSEEENKKLENPFPQDRDDENFKNKDSDSDSDEDSENEQLMKEFEQIKKQREEEQKRKLQEQEDLNKDERAKEILKGNPLLDQQHYSLKKKWFEDSVFKNQAKSDPKERQRFINDTVRSDFHRKFLNKFILN